MYYSAINKVDQGATIDTNGTYFGMPVANLKGDWTAPWRSATTAPVIWVKFPEVTPLCNVALFNTNLSQTATWNVRILGQPTAANLTWSATEGLTDHGDGSFTLSNWTGTLLSNPSGALILAGGLSVTGHNAETVAGANLVEGTFTCTGVTGTITAIEVRPILHAFTGPAIGPQTWWGAETWGAFRQDGVADTIGVFPVSPAVVLEGGVPAGGVWISIQDPTNPDGFIEANQLHAAPGAHIFRGAPLEAERGYTKDSGVRCRTASMTFENLPQAQAWHLLHRMPFDAPFFFSLSPFAMTAEGQPDWPKRQADAFFARRLEGVSASSPYANHGTVNVNVQEVKER